MGLFDKIRGEFIDIIEWLDPSNNIMIFRFNRYQNEIKMGAKLTVRESQVAVFVNEGKIADVYQPGMYTLTTENMPLMTTLKGWKYGFNSPFKAEVYFINTKNFTDNKWGTKNPVMMRDVEFGVVRLRAFGSYAMKISNPVNFIKQIAGTDGVFTTEEVVEQLKNIIVTRFSDAIGECKIPVLDLAAKYDEMSSQIQTKIKPEFDEYGLDLTKFLIENISLPPEVEAAIDKRTSMGVVGDLNKYSQFQAANAMEAAAKNPSGEASSGIGMGMGFAMANQMANTMNNQNANTASQNTGSMPPPLPNAAAYFIAVNGKQEGPLDMNVLKAYISQGSITRETLVWKQGMDKWTAANEVAEINSLFGMVPPPIPTA